MKIMRIVFSTVVAVCFAVMMFGAEISGPESVQTGQLVTFTADIEGDWLVVPAKGVGVAKDTGKKALYFAATCEGDYTLIFFAVENGAPVITQKALTVGEVKPEPKPEPEPSPDPNPAPTVMLTAAERAAVSSVMTSIIKGIDVGTIRTPQGARATFKQMLSDKICSGGSCALSNELTQAIKDWESTMDITTLSGIRSGFTTILETFK